MQGFSGKQNKELCQKGEIWVHRLSSGYCSVKVNWLAERIDMLVV